jgi:hypothetical protein
MKSKQTNSKGEKINRNEFPELEGIRKLDLVVKENSTVDLTMDSKLLKNYIQVVQLKDVDLAKRLIGVPDEFAQPKDCGCGKMGRVPSLADLSSKDKTIKEDALSAARSGLQQYILGDSRKVVISKKVLNKYLEITKAKINILWIKDIIVHNNATLNINNGLTSVLANKIRLFGTGKIVCNGPKTFKCTSFEGKL